MSLSLLRDADGVLLAVAAAIATSPNMVPIRICRTASAAVAEHDH